MPSTVAREYLRVSLDRTGTQRSPREQHDDNARTAGARGWTLGDPYKDIGSASRYATKRREDFDRLIEDLKNNTFGAQILILWESSRGSRRVSEWVLLTELCEERGVHIHVTSDGKTYDPADPRDRRSLLEDSVDAEYESAKVSKRTKRAAASTAAAGKPSGRVPYGYLRRYDPTTRQLVAQEPHPDESEVIKELFSRIRNGHSLRGIAKDFEERGIRTRSGLVFTGQHLRSLATTRAYVGERVHDPNRDHGHRLSATATITKATWPALIDRATWLAVQQILTDPSRQTSRPGRGVHFLSMIAVCDVCGGPLAARQSKEDNRIPEYTCHKGGHVRVAYDDLNALAEAAILGYLGRRDNADRLMSSGTDPAQLAAIREQIAEIQAELDDLAEQVGSGQLSATLAARAEPKIMERLKKAQAKEAELIAPSALRNLVGPGEWLEQQWDDMPMAARREVARMLLNPKVIGELRVTRSSTPGHRCPVEDRVIWRKTE